MITLCSNLMILLATEYAAVHLHASQSQLCDWVIVILKNHIVVLK
jgi:hypothetical protein